MSEDKNDRFGDPRVLFLVGMGSAGIIAAGFSEFGMVGAVPGIVLLLAVHSWRRRVNMEDDER